MRRISLLRIVQPDVFFILLIVWRARPVHRIHAHPGVFAPGVIGASRPDAPGALRDAHATRDDHRAFLMIVLALGLFVLEAKVSHARRARSRRSCVHDSRRAASWSVRRSREWASASRAAVAVALPFGVIVIILMRAVLRSRSWKQQTGREELIGEEGQVVEPVSAVPGATGSGARARGIVARGDASRRREHPERRARARETSRRTVTLGRFRWSEPDGA